MALLVAWLRELPSGEVRMYANSGTPSVRAAVSQVLAERAEKAGSR